MPVARVKAYLDEKGVLSRYREFPVSSATVEQAAQAIGCEPGRIAKTLVFLTKDGPILILLRGTAKVDNKKYKAVFGEKAVFPPPEDFPRLVGYHAGGVCPFAIPSGVRIYLDTSLREFDPVYPAAGASNNAVELNLEELERITGGKWIAISKG